LRLVTLAIVLVTALSARSAESQYPLWDGEESVEAYANRVGLEPTKTIDLGNGVLLELVLIPAGTFLMGTPEPEPVDEEGFYAKIRTGVVVLLVAGGLLLGLLGIVVIRAIRNRQRPQYSLAWFLVMAIAAGIGLLGGLHWYFSAQALVDARSEYQAALARFQSSYDWEKPAHEVTLTQAFYLGKYEVTQEQYQEVMGNNPSRFKGRDLPVETVSWEDAQAFCKKASEKTGLVVRLPTDAEWERACRAGTKTTYYTGDTDADLDRAGWYGGNSKGATHPAGQKVANAWGVYDMHGNVWEWCADWFEEYKGESAVDPHGPAEGQYRVLRGGSWDFDPGRCRSAYRFGGTPGYRSHYFGFRVVWLVPRTP